MNLTKTRNILLALSVCATLQVHAKQQDSEKMWLSYYDPHHVSTRFDLSMQYYCVRFTKPVDWPALSVDSVEVVWESSTGKTVKLCFWKNFAIDDDTIWPVDQPQQSDTKTIYQSSDDWNSNKWTVESLNWTTDEENFFIGFEQIGASSKLCGDGLNQPENRSYRQKSGQSWTREYGFMANYCIAAYVSKEASISIDEDIVKIPEQVIIYQNYPNPFNSSTKIRFTLPKPEHVKIDIYNNIGQKVKTLINKHMPAVNHEVEFNANDLPSGIYIYSIDAGEFHQVKKMVLLK